MARLDGSMMTGAACGLDAPAIEVRSLSFAYPDADAAVLEGLDWSVPKVHLRCLSVVPGRVSQRCSRCSSPRFRRRANALASCACWARALPT